MATTKYKIGKDGYFSTKVWDGTYTEDGLKHRKNLRTKQSSRKLEQMVKEFEASVESRKHIRQSEITFLEYARLWKDVYKKSKSANTKAMYENLIEKHFITLAGIKLQAFDRIHIQTLLNNADGKNRTQQQLLMASKQVLRSAVIDKLFPANVFEDIFQNIDSVTYVPEEKRPLADHEKKAVFDANYKYDKDRAYVYLIYGCGLRREEALALTVFDFNFKKNTLSVNSAYEFTNNTPTLKGPKSKNGYRDVPIPGKILPFVKSFVDVAKRRGRAHIFAMRGGKPVSKSSYDKMWARILLAMQSSCKEQIDGLTGHVFRHNYCTNLCYQIPKVSIKKIAQLMGDTEKMVLDVYNHIILEKEDASGAVDAAMNF